MSKYNLAAKLAASLEGSNIGVPSPVLIAPIEPGDHVVDEAVVDNEVDSLVNEIVALAGELPGEVIDVGETITDVQDAPNDADVALEDGLDSTDSMMGDGAPIDTRFVTVDDLEEHLEEDREVHAKLHEEIHQVRDMVKSVDQTADMVCAFESISSAAMAFMAPSLESLAKRTGVPVPELFYRGDRLTTTSLEDMNAWVASIQRNLKNTAKELGEHIKLTTLRSVKFHMAFSKRIDYMREQLRTVEEITEHEFTIPRQYMTALIVDGAIATDLSSEIERYTALVEKVSKQAPIKYRDALKGMYDPISKLGLAESDVEFEALLKEVASHALDFGFYYQIEPGHKKYLGDVTYRAPLTSPGVSGPEWFHPVLDMAYRPPYEWVVNNSVAFLASNPKVQSVDKTTALKILDTVAFSIKRQAAVQGEYRTVLKEINTIADRAMNKLERLAASQDTSVISKTNLRLADHAMIAAARAADALYYPLNLLSHNLDQSLFAALLVVERSVMGK